MYIKLQSHHFDQFFKNEKSCDMLKKIVMVITQKQTLNSKKSLNTTIKWDIGILGMLSSKWIRSW